MINFKKDYNSNLESNYIPQYALGAPTSVQTANQIAEATARLNAGVYGVDLALIDERIFEHVPKQHFKEIDRLMKLTGAKAGIHGPIVDLAGFTQQGWAEDTRRENERKVNYFMDMAHELDAKGNTPLNFHINTAMIGNKWRKLTDDEYKKLSPEEKETLREVSVDPLTGKKQYEVKEFMGVVHQDTGQLNILKRETKQYPGQVKVWTPEERLKNINETTWDEEKLKVFEYQRHKAQIEDRLLKLNQEIQPYIYGAKKDILTSEEERLLQERIKEIQRLNAHVNELDTHIMSNLREVYHQLKYVSKEDKSKRDEVVRNIQENYLPVHEKIKELTKIYPKGLPEEKYEEYKNLINQEVRELQLALEKAPTPQIWTPSNTLAQEKTAETVANVVYDSYKKYKDNTPILLLENVEPSGTLGSAQDLVNAVEESRKRFAEKLVREKNISQEEAKKTAEKLIGVTWDVSHINFLRKYGYSEEEIKEETKKIAPYVKKVHVADNFGFSDTHLAPGMGNAPIKEEMEIIAKELKKKGLKFEKGDVLVEAGGFVSQFKENPHLYALEYFDSPLYTYKTEPYWKEIWEKEAPYFTGFGPIFPEQHFALYGAGFSNLPAELGGPIQQQDRSRFAGTPMA